jgi:hypothetical protein
MPAFLWELPLGIYLDQGFRQSAVGCEPVSRATQELVAAA